MCETDFLSLPFTFPDGSVETKAVRFTFVKYPT